MLYSGTQKSNQIKESLKTRVSALGYSPKVAILSCGTHPSISSYVAIKKRFAEYVGVTLVEHTLDNESSTEDLLKEISKIEETKEYKGLIVQLPLPGGIDTEAVLRAIPESLDVDVLGPLYNKFVKNEFEGPVLPPVVRAIETIIEDVGILLTNKNIVVVGAGRLVGAPVAEWLKNLGHIPEVIDIDTDVDNRRILLQEADIIISGTGVPHSIGLGDIKSGVILIDAGTSEQTGVLSGDIDPECREKADLVTPVPGGVGPLTVACLFENIVEFAERKL